MLRTLFPASCCALLLILPSLCCAQEFKRETALTLAVRKAKPSVISIKVERDFSYGKKESIGTGVIIDERGYAVTNCHVIARATRILVALSDRTEVNATVLVEDPTHDLAILRLTGRTKFQALKFGPSSDLMEAEVVVAIGHPFGYTFTVCDGIISSLDREITVNGETLPGLVQHSAPINPGNSGGPLLNINGELIGINVALREGAQNIGFAIPSDMVQKTLARHLNARKISKVDHGLRVAEKVVATTGTDRQQVLVKDVADHSPAAEAGLKTGDVLIRLAGWNVHNRFDVERAFWAYKPGDQVEAKVMRAGRELVVSLNFEPKSGIVAVSAETASPSPR
jgi:serine protease Do